VAVSIHDDANIIRHPMTPIASQRVARPYVSRLLSLIGEPDLGVAELTPDRDQHRRMFFSAG